MHSVRRYTFDAPDFSICTECCNGVNPYGKIAAHINATRLCDCTDGALDSHEAAPLVYDMLRDPTESAPLTNATIF